MTIGIAASGRNAGLAVFRALKSGRVGWFRLYRRVRQLCRDHERRRARPVHDAARRNIDLVRRRRAHRHRSTARCRVRADCRADVERTRPPGASRSVRGRRTRHRTGHRSSIRACAGCERGRIQSGCPRPDDARRECSRRSRCRTGRELPCGCWTSRHRRARKHARPQYRPHGGSYRRRIGRAPQRRIGSVDIDPAQRHSPGCRHRHDGGRCCGGNNAADLVTGVLDRDERGNACRARREQLRAGRFGPSRARDSRPRTRAFFRGAGRASPIYIGSHVWQGGKRLGYTVFEPYVVLVDGVIESLIGQRSLRVGCRSADLDPK